MGQALRADQVKANRRIMAWLEGRPYREYPEQRRPRVPELKPEFVLRTYTPPHPAWSEQFFTPLEAACEALKDVALRDGMHVLEPAAGIGHLIRALEVLSNTYSPAPAAVSICMTAYEIEALAHRIGAKLFPWVAWFNRNIFQAAGELAGQFDLVVCNPPFGGGRHLGPQDRSGWHAPPTEYLFLELAARALKPGGQAVFIAPAHFVARIPEELEVYLNRAGLVLTGRSEKPLPGDFLTTGLRVHSFYWNKEEGTADPDQDGMPNYPDGDWLWVIAHFSPSGAVDVYPALGGPREPSVEGCICIIGDNWQAGHRLEPYGPFPVGAQLPRLG